jgi:hypothetical protein
MQTPNRKFVYNNVIKVSRGDMTLLRAGKKKCTIRMGNASVATPQISMSDGRTSVLVQITDVDSSRTFEQLTDEDAQAEGFSTRDELISDLRHYYPRAQPTDPVTVIRFELVSQPPSLFDKDQF